MNELEKTQGNYLESARGRVKKSWSRNKGEKVGGYNSLNPYSGLKLKEDTGMIEGMRHNMPREISDVLESGIKGEGIPWDSIDDTYPYAIDFGSLEHINRFIRALAWMFVDSARIMLYGRNNDPVLTVTLRGMPSMGKTTMAEHLAMDFAIVVSRVNDEEKTPLEIFFKEEKNFEDKRGILQGYIDRGAYLRKHREDLPIIKCLDENMSKTYIPTALNAYSVIDSVVTVLKTLLERETNEDAKKVIKESISGVEQIKVSEEDDHASIMKKISPFLKGVNAVSSVGTVYYVSKSAQLIFILRQLNPVIVFDDAHRKPEDKFATNTSDSVISEHYDKKKAGEIGSYPDALMWIYTTNPEGHGAVQENGPRNYTRTLLVEMTPLVELYDIDRSLSFIFSEYEDLTKEEELKAFLREKGREVGDLITLDDIFYYLKDKDRTPKENSILENIGYIYSAIRDNFGLSQIDIIDIFEYSYDNFTFFSNLYAQVILDELMLASSVLGESEEERRENFDKDPENENTRVFLEDEGVIDKLIGSINREWINLSMKGWSDIEIGEESYQKVRGGRLLYKTPDARALSAAYRILQRAAKKGATVAAFKGLLALLTSPFNLIFRSDVSPGDLLYDMLLGRTEVHKAMRRVEELFGELRGQDDITMLKSLIEAAQSQEINYNGIALAGLRNKEIVEFMGRISNMLSKRKEDFIKAGIRIPAVERFIDGVIGYLIDDDDEARSIILSHLGYTIDFDD